MAKKKKKRRRRGVGLAIIELFLAIVIICILLGMGIYLLCPLKQVDIEGTELYSTEQIEEYILDDKYCVNTVYVYLKNKIKPKTNAEFIDHFDVKITGRNSILINAVEKTILGYMVYEDEYIYFDYNGTIQQISTSYVDGYMKVDGEIIEDPVEGEKLSIGSDKVGFLVSVIKILSKDDLVPNELDYDEYGRITLVFDTYKICLGNNDYLEDKMERLEYILPQIDGLYGTLHLENYSTDNTDIVFEEDKNDSE